MKLPDHGKGIERSGDREVWRSVPSAAVDFLSNRFLMVETSPIDSESTNVVVLGRALYSVQKLVDSEAWVPAIDVARQVLEKEGFKHNPRNVAQVESLLTVIEGRVRRHKTYDPEVFKEIIHYVREIVQEVGEP